MLAAALCTWCCAQEGGPLPLGDYGDPPAADPRTEAQRHADVIARLERAAQAGDAQSQLQLAVALFGEPARADFTPVEFWLGKSAAQGLGPAQYMLGMLFASDTFPGGPRYDLAVSWLRPLAAKGNAEAQSLYGKFLIEGTGVSRDIALGMSYLTLAATSGDANARVLIEFYRTDPPAVKPASIWRSFALKRC